MGCQSRASARGVELDFGSPPHKCLVLRSGACLPCLASPHSTSQTTIVVVVVWSSRGDDTRHLSHGYHQHSLRQIARRRLHQSSRGLGCSALVGLPAAVSFSSRISNTSSDHHTDHPTLTTNETRRDRQRQVIASETMPFSPQVNHTSSAFAQPVNDDYNARPLIHHQHQAVSPASPSSSQGSSSSSFNYRPTISSSSSSSVDTSPPSHKSSHSGGVGAGSGSITTTAPYSSLAHFSPRSPRSQHPDDLLKVQRHLYQQANAGGHASSFSDWPRRDSQPHTARTMNAAEASTSALTRPSPPPPPPSAATHQREDTLSATPERGTRGSKSRRASSGGSRIPYERQEEAAAMAAPAAAAASSSSSSSSAFAAPASASTSSPAQRGLASASPPAGQRPARPSSPSLLSPPQAAAGGAHTRPLPHVDLATYPSQDLLRILAALLQQIATTNDAIRPPNAAEEERDRKRSAKGRAGGGSSSGGAGGHSSGTAEGGFEEGASTSWRTPQGVTTAAMGALGQPSSTLCFHARNVPSISIESYLLRILKYCPTTNDVFLSLAVYLDRMSRVAQGADVNDNPDAHNGVAGPSSSSAATTPAQDDVVAPHIHPGMKGFAVDSYNIHRLVIAGVTVGSKFFSDVFYTNSRYAKVGGLPVHELNQLELQFLLLNDFKLVIPLSELQSYADRLLVYATDQGAVQTRPVKELGAPGGETQGQAQRRSSQSSSATAAAASTSARGSSSASSSATTPHATSSSSPRPDRSAAAAVQMQEG